MALVQSSLKRMLAYSATAHSGYIAIALCALGGTDSNGASAILFYLVSYTIVSLGAFAVIMSFETEENDNLTLSDIGGLAKRYPGRAFALAAFMFSFAGMPPTAGFVGKFFVFKAAVEQQLFALVIIGAIGSAISLYYYLRVIVRMYMQDGTDGDEVATAKPGLGSIAFIGATVALTVLLGTILPGQLMQKINVITQQSH
jgi:NADH-quinone oxidoreductase subunit N